MRPLLEEEKAALKSLSFESGESLLGIWETRYEVVRGMWKKGLLSTEKIVDKDEIRGFVVFTDSKIAFIEKRGVLNHSFHCRLSMPYEDIVGISKGGSFIKYLSLTDRNNIEHRILAGQDRIDIMVKTVDQLSSHKKSIIAKKEKEGKIQVVLDFSFLKNLVEKGGLVLTTLSCPHCGGTVELPSSGNTFTCPYCNTQIHATDIFEKLRELLKGV